MPLNFNCFKACIHSFHSVTTAAMDKPVVKSRQETQCLETPVLALTSTWRWLTLVCVSSSPYWSITQCSCNCCLNNSDKCYNPLILVLLIQQHPFLVWLHLFLISVFFFKYAVVMKTVNCYLLFSCIVVSIFHLFLSDQWSTERKTWITIQSQYNIHALNKTY